MKAFFYLFVARLASVLAEPVPQVLSPTSYCSQGNYPTLKSLSALPEVQSYCSSAFSQIPVTQTVLSVIRTTTARFTTATIFLSNSQVRITTIIIPVTSLRISTDRTTTTKSLTTEFDITTTRGTTTTASTTILSSGVTTITRSSTTTTTTVTTVTATATILTTMITTITPTIAIPTVIGKRAVTYPPQISSRSIHQLEGRQNNLVSLRSTLQALPKTSLNSLCLCIQQPATKIVIKTSTSLIASSRVLSTTKPITVTQLATATLSTTTVKSTNTKSIIIYTTIVTTTATKTVTTTSTMRITANAFLTGTVTSILMTTATETSTTATTTRTVVETTKPSTIPFCSNFNGILPTVTVTFVSTTDFFTSSLDVRISTIQLPPQTSTVMVTETETSYLSTVTVYGANNPGKRDIQERTLLSHARASPGSNYALPDRRGVVVAPCVTIPTVTVSTTITSRGRSSVLVSVSTAATTIAPSLAVVTYTTTTTVAAIFTTTIAAPAACTNTAVTNMNYYAGLIRNWNQQSVDAVDFTDCCGQCWSSKNCIFFSSQNSACKLVLGLPSIGVPFYVTDQCPNGITFLTNVNVVLGANTGGNLHIGPCDVAGSRLKR